MTFYKDKYGIRYQQVGICSSIQKSCLFLPGGPGIDSAYFEPLIKLLSLPTHTWLLDFPGNGSNGPKNFLDFDSWFKLFPIMVSRFEKPILIGHSFGAILPLLFPELEDRLSGLILLNGRPSSSKRNIRWKKEEKEFLESPSQKTFNKALLASSHRHFMRSSAEKGGEFLKSLPFNWQAPLWWMKKSKDIDYHALWVPKKVPTLILGGDKDLIAPFDLFMEDPRFKKPHISLKIIKNSKHHCWFDNPKDTKEAIYQFLVEIFQQDGW